MVFLPGDHGLNANITVTNITRLTLFGQSYSSIVATITCNEFVGLSFTSIVHFRIDSLAFTSCSRNDSTSPASNYVLLLQFTQYAELVNCYFHDNLGTALVVKNSNITFTGNSQFRHNHCKSNTCTGASGIIALSSNLTFTGNINFLENIAAFNGPHSGAIYASSNSILNFNGNSNFVNNSAYNGGGAILTSENTVLNFNRTTHFVSNYAYSGGGAIYTTNNTVLTFNETTNFVNNLAYRGGGAIITSFNVVLIFSGTNRFIGNLADFGGGAILALLNTLFSFNGMSNFSSNSVNRNGGSAISTSQNTELKFNGTNNFVSNSAGYGYGIGGAISTSENTLISFSGNSYFINNSAGNGYHGGGAIYTSNNTRLNFNGTNNFVNNRKLANKGGGAISTSSNTELSFSGISNFINNSAKSGGGAIFTNHSTVISFSGTSNFICNFIYSNLNFGGGAIYTSLNTTLSLNGINNFINNSVYLGGGAIFTQGSTVTHFNGTSNFISNSAAGLGAGAVCTSYSIVLTFNGNSNFIGNRNSARSGGAVSISHNTSLSFNGTNNFVNNSARNIGGGVGGAIYSSRNARLIFNGINNFTSNSADHSGGAIYASSISVLRFDGASNFVNNSAGNGGAISAETNGTLIFNGTIIFTNNCGQNYARLNEITNGGGVYMGLNSSFFILPNATVHWENNHATFGGAIYVFDASHMSYCNSTYINIATLIPKEDCYFQLPGLNLSNIHTQLFFKNNSADIAGSALYGGVIDNCKLMGLDSYSSGKVFDMLVQIDDLDHSTTSNISSEPLRICPCENNLPDCSALMYGHKMVNIKAYPGQIFQVSVVAAGQRNGMVSSTVRSKITNDIIGSNLEVDLQDYQYLQQANNTCTQLNYTVFSLSKSVVIELQAEGNPCSKFDNAYTMQYSFLIEVALDQTCPTGLNISKSARACVCEPRLTKYTGTHQCTIANAVGLIRRDSGQQFWVGYDHQSDGLILHPHCPFDYCVTYTVVFSLSNADSQCAYDRSELLCGACKKNYSLALGSSQCMQCTNSYLALLIPFALMGVALVCLLLVSKLTVATGMLSGMVIYANIVGANRTIFLPMESAFSVFIAWLNLDFGIDACFYNGMNAYSKTWLQFVFLVYIWVIVGLIILVSHFSRRFGKLLGNNPVSVLATLILLSYTKILHTLIAVLYITYLEYPTYKRWVWLQDANIDYLSGKHIPLFLVAVLIFLFLFLPYTLLLLFGQWLQALSHFRLFSWVNSTRLKAFMDSYHAPYKPKHRYWPGLLLMLRFALLIVFSVNPQQNTNINLLAILVGTGFLVAWGWVSGGVYRNWCLDALESSFALNMIILVGATFYVKLAEGSQLVVGYISVSVAFVTFIGILIVQLANVTGIAHRKCATLATRIAHQDEREMEPDRLVNPDMYEAHPYIPQRECLATVYAELNEEELVDLD